MSGEPPVRTAPLGDERTELIHVNGLKLLCRQWGDAAAPPIVLLHGLRGFSGTWRALAAALSHGYRLIAFDQRGRGESDWDPECGYYTDAYLADLEGIVDQLGLRRFALVGHSMGGTTSYVYADRHSDRVAALVIEDIAPGSSISGSGARRIVAEMQAMPIGFASWDEARAYWRTQRPTLGVALIEQRVEESLRLLPNGRITWRFDADGIRRTRVNPDSDRILDLWPIVERLRTPTLVIHGGRSDFCAENTVAMMRSRNTHITSVMVPEAGHYVHDDAPAAFIEHMVRFIGPLWAPSEPDTAIGG